MAQQAQSGGLRRDTSGGAAASNAGAALRKSLFEMLALYSEEGHGTPAEYRNQLRRAVGAAVSKLKDADGLESVKLELGQMADFLDHSARLARAALLQARVVFRLLFRFCI